MMMSISSCSESELSGEEVASLSGRYLSTSVSSLNFVASASSQKMDVYSHTTPWQISNRAHWITLSESIGDGNSSSTPLSISVKENNSGDTLRTHILLLESTASDWKHTCPISVSQDAAVPYIIPVITSIEIPGRETTQEIHISSNTEWVPKCDMPFLNVERSGDKLIIHATENVDTEHGRRGEVLLVGSTTSSVVVTQAPSDIKVESDTLFFDNTAASYSLSINSDLPWTASTTYPWIQVLPASGTAGTSELIISVTPNTTTQTREGSVYLKINGKSVKIPIYQRGYYVEVDKNYIEFGSHGGVMELSLSTNDKWETSLSGNDWLSLSPAKGDNSGSVILNAGDNPTISSRNASLSINTTYSGSIVVDIKQNGRYLRASAESISFFGKGGICDPLYIYTDAKYKVTKSGEWFSMTEKNGVFQVSVGNNDSGNWREGSITFTATDLTQGELVLTIPVTQAIEGLTFSKELYKTDIDYNLLNSYGLSISILSYNSDIDYNASGINGFIKDAYNNRGDVNSGYSEGIDKGAYNDPDNTGNNINKDNYNSETNYDE